MPGNISTKRGHPGLRMNRGGIYEVEIIPMSGEDADEAAIRLGLGLQ